MKLGKFALAAGLLALGACNEATGPSEPADRVLLEIEYVNYAWTPTWFGFFVDAKGDVYSYNREGMPWPHAEEQILTEAQLTEKFQRRTKLASRDSGEAATVVARIAVLNKAQVSPQKAECADAGALTYRAYTYNTANRTYQPILLRVEGDFAQQNTSAAAQELIAYVRSLGLIDELLGCDP